MAAETEDALARTRAILAEMRAEGQIPPQLEKTRRRRMREAVLPDDIGSIFGDLWRTFRSAPLWQKPLVAIVLVFGATLHVLTALIIAGGILSAVIPFVVLLLGVGYVVITVVGWIFAAVKTISG